MSCQDQDFPATYPWVACASPPARPSRNEPDDRLAEALETLAETLKVMNQRPSQPYAPPPARPAQPGSHGKGIYSA